MKQMQLPIVFISVSGTRGLHSQHQIVVGLTWAQKVGEDIQEEFPKTP